MLIKQERETMLALLLFSSFQLVQFAVNKHGLCFAEHNSQSDDVQIRTSMRASKGYALFIGYFIRRHFYGSTIIYHVID